MFGIENYSLFLVTTILLTITPGPTMVYILSRSIAQGRKAGILSSLGINSAAFAHTLAAALGLSAIMATSATAFTVIKVVGSLFLIYLGIRCIVEKSNLITLEKTTNCSTANWKIYAQGFLIDLLNPKVAIFFLSFFPQFIDQTSDSKIHQFIILGFTFISIGILWEMTLVLFSSKITEAVRQNSFLSVWLNRIMGAVLITLGLRLLREKL